MSTRSRTARISTVIAAAGTIAVAGTLVTAPHAAAIIIDQCDRDPAGATYLAADDLLYVPADTPADAYAVTHSVYDNDGTPRGNWASVRTVLSWDHDPPYWQFKIAEGEFQPFVTTAPFTGSMQATYCTYDSSPGTGYSNNATVDLYGGLAVPEDDNDTVNGLDAVTLDVLANDVYLPGSTVVVADPPKHGKVTTDGETISFRPEPGYSGTVTFTYRVDYVNTARPDSPHTVTSDKATVTLDVTTPALERSTSLTLRGPDQVSAGDSATLRALLTERDRPKQAVDGADITLWKWDDGERTKVSQRTTSAGAATFTLTPRTSQSYQVTFGGSKTYRSASSDRHRVVVRTDPDITATVSDRAVKAGDRISITGKVDPATEDIRMWLEKRVGGEWLTFAVQPTDARGVHRFTWNTVTTGTYAMRVVTNRHGASEPVRFEVR